MDEDKLRILWQEAEEASFQGWDFSKLDGRWQSEDLPWDYQHLLKSLLTPTDYLLDMGTGGGEFLLSLHHPYHLTSVTEGYDPNLKLCQERLAPLGICVKAVAQDNKLNFPDACFDFIANRHEEYDAQEIYRCLKPGGVFITQQVGGSNNNDLAIRLLNKSAAQYSNHTLAYNMKLLQDAGFVIEKQMEVFPWLRFYDIAAMVYFAKIISWEFPDFSVNKCFNQLLELHSELENKSFVQSTEHRFMIIARKTI